MHTQKHFTHTHTLTHIHTCKRQSQMQLLRQKENFLQNKNWQNPRTKKKKQKKRKPKNLYTQMRKCNNINKAAL